MTLRGRLGRAIMRRIEASPRVQEQHERTERLKPHMQAAEELAYGALRDEEACEQLRPRVAGNEQAVLDAIEWLGRRRDEYIGDRAYRLLLAAATDTPVKPIDPAMADLFTAERELGSLPLEDAFARLVEIEPGLRALAEATGGGDTRDEAFRGDQPDELVGFGARTDDPLLQSDLAASIVGQYLLARSDRPEIDVTRSYFEGPRKTGVLSGSFFGPGRPRARN